jgi:hypothetical protein
VIINESQYDIDLISKLKKGRYLIENRKTKIDFIFIWILNDRTLFKHLKYSSNEIEEEKMVDFRISLDTFIQTSDKIKNKLKKIMYYKSNNQIEMKKYRNDFNVTCLDVSNNHFELIFSTLSDSSNQLCKSLRNVNQYSVAYI